MTHAAQGRAPPEPRADAGGRAGARARGPFGNIAHGCNSLIATRTALALGDVVVTEAGFGSDLGAEKFFDIKCRAGGLKPEAAVLVATVRSLKMQGGAPKTALDVEDLGALERGLPHLEHHVAERAAVRRAGRRRAQPPHSRTPTAELQLRASTRPPRWACRSRSCDVWARGGAGGEELAREVHGDCSAAEPADFRADLRDGRCRSARRSTTIVQRVYGGDGVDYSASGRAADRLAGGDRDGRHAGVHGEDAVLADGRSDAARGARRGFRITINEVWGAAGAGFVVARAGDIMTMPGLPKVPAAEGMRVEADGAITGLS